MYLISGLTAMSVMPLSRTDMMSDPKSTPLQVGPTVGPAPTAAMTCQAGNSTKGIPVSCNASASQPGSGATIASYTFNWVLAASLTESPVFVATVAVPV